MSLNDLTRAQRLQNAAKLSAWLYVHEPGLFRQLSVSLPRLQRARLGRFGDNGDIPDLSTITVSAPDPSGSFISSGGASDIAPDLTSFTPDLSSVGVDTSLTGAVSDPVSAAIAAPPTVDASVADASSSSGGFWDSLSSGLGSAASTIGKVAGALVSPPAIAAAGTAAAAYFRGQAASAQAQAQQAAVQLQLARVAQGAAPAPVTYTRNPYTGALQPTYLSNTGAQPLTGSLMNQLLTPSTVSGGIAPLWLIGGGLALIAILVAAGSRSGATT